MIRSGAAMTSASEPYTSAMIAGLLRAMPADRLHTVRPSAFQTWPTRKIVPGKIILELIANEQDRRRQNAR
jgi:hypothetical protein